MKYLKQNAGCIYPVVLGGHEGHTTKAAVHYASHSSLSRGNLKNLICILHFLCASFTDTDPSTIITRRCVLRSTLANPRVPTVWP